MSFQLPTLLSDLSQGQALSLELTLGGQLLAPCVSPTLDPAFQTHVIPLKSPYLWVVPMRMLVCPCTHVYTYGHAFLCPELPLSWPSASSSSSMSLPGPVSTPAAPLPSL